MPLTYRIDPSRSIVVATADSALTESDIRAWRATVQADPSFSRRLNQLLDLRAVRSVSVSVPALARFAATSPFHPGTLRVFIASTDLQYELAHTFALLSEPHQHDVYVFRDLGAAEAWVTMRS
jgi:hypothetical protein